MRTMSSATLRLVLLVSCAHALVHVYEHSLACVEPLVAVDPDFDVDPARPTEVTGQLGSALRLPYGLCALLAGWMADRFGAKRLLIVYLIGCSSAALLACWAAHLATMYLAMFLLGLFASIYHPAGVGLITHHTTPENRPMALGYHGVFGSAGIAAGPFLAGLVLLTGAGWRQYYLVLVFPGLVLGGLLLLRLSHADGRFTGNDPKGPVGGDEDGISWTSYFTLLAMASLAGFVYAGILNFMPRYLTGAGMDIDAALHGLLGPIGLSTGDAHPASAGNFLTSGVLLLGILGQYTAGRIAKPTTLEPLMACALFAAAPCVFWMGFAQGPTRLVAAGLFSPLFLCSYSLMHFCLVHLCIFFKKS